MLDNAFRFKLDDPPHGKAKRLSLFTPSSYWVITCVILALVLTACEQPGNRTTTHAPEFDYFVLALSWQPAFCERARRKPECVSQHPDRYDAHHVTLHGLWPNTKDDPRRRLAYCGVSGENIKKSKQGNWCKLPPLELSERTRTHMEQYMPGNQSCLHRHEWVKHGTCSGLEENDYFSIANQLTRRIGGTAFNQLLQDATGQRVKQQQLRNALVQDFGAEAARKVNFRCKPNEDKVLLTDIYFYLDKTAVNTPATTVKFTDITVPNRSNCPNTFHIDAAGFALSR